MNSVLLNSPIIVIISFFALLSTLSARFIKHKYIVAVLYIVGFLCVVGCVTYALLLGVELTELLTYILIFTLVGITAFIPIAQRDSSEIAPPVDNEKSVVDDNKEDTHEL